MRPFISKKSFLIGAVEEQLIPTVTGTATTITLGTIAQYLSAGTGAKVTVAQSDGVITGVTATATVGSGYTVGDFLTVAGGTGGVIRVATVGALGAFATGTVVNGGTSYTSADEFVSPYSLAVIAAPLSQGFGATVTITVSTGAIATAVVGAGGAGYAVGDLLLVEGGANGVLRVATLAGTAAATFTIYQAGSGYSATTLATDPLPGFCLEFPRVFVIQDGTYSEQITISEVQATTGVYTVKCNALTNTYTAPYASILTPGVPMTLQNKDFNCRIRNITSQPKIDFDGESEKYGTGDFRKDLGIATTQEGDISFDEKVSISISGGTGLLLDITAVNGAITVATVHAAGGGTGYSKGDWLTVVESGGAGAHIVVTAVTAGVVTAVLIADAGYGYSTDSGGSNVTVLPLYVPTWNKFVRAMGHKVKIYSTSGAGFLPVHDADDVTMTIWKCEVQGGAAPKGKAYKYSGCFGDGGLKAEMTQAYKLNGKYQGKFIADVDLTTAQIALLTAPDTNNPEKMLSNVAKTIAGGYPTIATTGTTNTGTALDLRVSSWELSFGNTISALPKQSDSTGHDYFMRTDASPKLTIDPLLKPVSEEDVTSNVLNQTTVDILLQSALTSPHISVECPVSQLTAYPGIADKNGFVVTNRVYSLKGNNITTSDVSPRGTVPSNGVQPAIPDEVPYEILIRARA